jgi:hypothetical protein
MPTKFKVLAAAAAIVAGTSGAAMAQYGCPAGYTYANGACQPVAAPGYAPAPGYPPAQPYASPTGPLSGAAAGSAAGAQSGGAAAGPVGAVVGGALGTATGAVQGTANMLTPPGMRCNAGYTYYNGACVPAR